MATNIPKPVFVLSDVYSDSFTTALNVVCLKLNNSEDSPEPILLCGTNDGVINMWSLSTYRCHCHINSTEVAKLTQLDQNDSLRINSIFSIPSNSILKIFCQIKISLLCLFEIKEKSKNDDDIVKSTLINKWNSFPTTFAKCFHLFDDCFVFVSSTNSDIFQLTNINRNINICALKLTSLQEQKADHGVVMSIHLFVVNVTPALLMPNNEKQALYILVAYEDGTIILYRVSLEDELKTIYKQTIKNSNRLLNALEVSVCKSHPEMITCVDFNEKVMRGVSCSVDNEIALWSVNLPEKVVNDGDSSMDARSKVAQMLENGKTGIYEHKGKRQKVTNAGILCCAIRPDGRIFATGGKDARVRLFALKSGKPLAILPFHSNVIECVHFSMNLSTQRDSTEKSQTEQVSTSVPTKYLLFASSRDKLISIWSLYNDQQ